MTPTLHTNLYDRTETEHVILGAHFWRVGAATDTIFAEMPVVSPVSLAADILLWDTLQVVRALHQARAAAPGATEDLLLVLAVFTGGGTIADQAGRQAAAQLSARTGNISLVLTERRSHRPCQYEDQHTEELYHI